MEMNRRDASGSWMIEGRQLPMPVQVRDATFAAAVFRCSTGAAADAIADTPFTPLSIGGKSFALLACIKYRDGDLGVYDEFGLAVMVRHRGSVGQATLDLPVTGTFTRAAGRAVWGLPKYLVEGSMVPETRQTRIELSEGDQFIMSGSIAASIPVPGRFPGKVDGWSIGLEGENQGRVLKTPGRMRIGGLRVRLGGNLLALGEHPMAVRARALGLDRRPIVSVTAQRLTMEIGDSIEVDEGLPVR